MANEYTRPRVSPLLSLLAFAHLHVSSAIPLNPRYANTTISAFTPSSDSQQLEFTSSTPTTEVNKAAGAMTSSLLSTPSTSPEQNDQRTNIANEIPDGQVQVPDDDLCTEEQSAAIAFSTPALPVKQGTPNTSSTTSDVVIPSPASISTMETAIVTPIALVPTEELTGWSTWIWGTSVGPYQTAKPPTFQNLSSILSTSTSTIYSTVTVKPPRSSTALDLTDLPGTTEVSALTDLPATGIPGLTIPGLTIPGLSNIPTAITVGTYATVSLTAPTIATVPDTILTSLSTDAVQSASSSVTQTMFTGSVETSLPTSGEPSLNPFPTGGFNTTSLSLIDTSTLSGSGPTVVPNATAISANNIFQVIATDAPPAQISSRGDHPVARLGIQSQQGTLETNKFYANFFLGNQNQPSWTHPYSVAWSKGGGSTSSWGLSVSHTERNQLYTGPPKQGSDAGKWAWFASPIGIQSLILSAGELGNGTKLTTDSLQAFSVNVNLITPDGTDPVMTFPLVQGMGFVTAVYKSATPLIQSSVGISNLTYEGAAVNGTTYRYRAALQNGFSWFIYITPGNSNYKTESFTLLNPSLIQGPSGFGGYIQVAKIPANTLQPESVYDKAAGAYATGANITGSVQGTAGSYSLTWTKQGVTTQSLLMFALPHHVSSFSSNTANSGTEIQLETTTKGIATALLADSWTLNEPNLPVSMGFGPWKQGTEKFNVISQQAISVINRVGTSELSQNIAQQTNVGSLYYDGKALAKFATICYTLHDIGGNATLALTGLQTLQNAMALHISNKMTYPLVYDTAWGGAVSIGSYLDGNSGDDFGNTYYNDHHFHYGYFVYAAAVIGYLNPSWLSQDTNKAWVNMLVRDYANSVSDDQYFPFSRMFDWYHGHSWAHGVIEAADGKDQESSSEDTMASYAIKMWGLVTGDTNMEARGNLMLAVQARSLNNYYLYTDESAVQPQDFIGNKAAGILFENKIDHTTYFGGNAEYIQGIHMLPLMPFSSYTRPATFVQQEWNAYFGDNGIRPASSVSGGWKGILMANYALVDPTSAYDFFANTSGTFNAGFLDGGASQTWYVAWAAGLGGSLGSNSNKKRDSLISTGYSAADEPPVSPGADGEVSMRDDWSVDGFIGQSLGAQPASSSSQMALAAAAAAKEATVKMTPTLATAHFPGDVMAMTATRSSTMITGTSEPTRRGMGMSGSSRLRQRMSGLARRRTAKLWERWEGMSIGGQ